jgi:acetylornithine/succinyldiaminopimelate/putrescine aminotransferase
MISQRQLFLQHVGQTSETPAGLEIVAAKGVWITDVNKKKYIDLIAGISVCNIGHRHPAVVRAVQKQVRKYSHLMVYGEYVQHPQTQFATLLTQNLPEKLNSVYFVNSGSEATEGAMKLAKRVTNRYEFVSFKNAYHGSTQGSLSLMGDDYFKSAFYPLLPGIKHIEYNNIVDLSQITDKTAAVFVEVIQGESGATPANPVFLQSLRKKCDQTGTLLVFDEIQSGFGRTGKLFAFEHYGVVPDILLIAKGMGGGLPIGAFVANVDLMNQLSFNPVLGHINTFGGNAVTTAAALASLKVLLKDKIVEQVQEKELLFRELLQHSKIKAINGKGLLMSVSFESQELNFKIIKQCMKNGVATDWFLFNSNSFRIAPPLTITKDEIKKSCKRILKSIDEVCNES